MALINENSPAANQDSSQFWLDELANARVLLYQLNLAISSLTTKGMQSYTIDTGQDRQTVTSADIGALYDRRDALLRQIADLESRLKIGGSHAVRVVPQW